MGQSHKKWVIVALVLAAGVLITMAEKHTKVSSAQIVEELKRDVPTGSKRRVVETYLRSRNAEYSITDDKIIAVFRCRPKDAAPTDLQVQFFFTNSGNLDRYSLREVLVYAGPKYPVR